MKEWFKCALVRAVKTMAQSAIAIIGTATVMGAVDWRAVLSATVLAGILSILTSVGGLPEVENNPISVTNNTTSSVEVDTPTNQATSMTQEEMESILNGSSTTDGETND